MNREELKKELKDELGRFLKPTWGQVFKLDIRFIWQDNEFGLKFISLIVIIEL